MCGIGGIVFVGHSSQDSIESASMMFNALEDRGRHASGVAWAWNDSDRWMVHKDAVKASELDWKRYTGMNHVKALMFHTRYTTQGSTENNNNNHPVVGHGWIVTHNGVLQNDDEIFQSVKTWNIHRLHEVDSEALNVLLNVGGVEHLTDMIRGSCSIAYVPQYITPTSINLYTNGRNPLVIARTTCGNVVYASGLHHIERAFDVETSFNAVPFKEYKLHFDGTIESEFISDERTSPTVIRGLSSEHPAGSTRKHAQRPANAKPVVWGGWIYDEDMDCWRKWRN